MIVENISFGSNQGAQQMARITGKEDLLRVREETSKKISPQTSDFNTKILVHMGTCGIAAGAKEVMEALQEELRQTEAKDIQVVASGCAGMCSSEPNVTIERKGEPGIMYQYVNRDKMHQIFKRHVIL